MTFEPTDHEHEDEPLLWEPPSRDPIVDVRHRALVEGAPVVAAAYGPCEIEGVGAVTHLEHPRTEGEVGEVTVEWPSGEELHVAIPDDGRLVADGLELVAA